MSYNFNDFLRLCDMYSDRGYDEHVKQAKEAVRYIENMVGSRHGRTMAVAFVTSLLASVTSADGFVSSREYNFFLEVTGYKQITKLNLANMKMDLIERGTDPDFMFMDEWRDGNYDRFYFGCQMMYLGLCTAASDGRINDDEARFLYLSVPAPGYND